MKRLWLIAVVLAVSGLLPTLLRAQEKPAADGSHRRVLLLLRQRPLLVELVLTIDEQPFIATDANAFAVQGQAFLAGRADGSQLMSLIDRDGNGQLSDEEMDSAPDHLRSSDADDNELVTLTEIAGYRNDLPAGDDRATATQESILALADSTVWKQLHAALVARYGAQRALPWAVAVDDDKDGKLSEEELKQLATIEAPLVLDIALGTRTRLRDTVAITRMADELKRIARVDRGADGKLLLDLISLRIEVLAPNPKPSPRMFAGQATAYLSNFDKDKNGYLERKELSDPALAAQFDAWDADANGMLFVDEIRDALEKADRPNWQRISVAGLVQGTDLFGQLDENRDQQLGHREVTGAAERLRTVALEDDETIRVAIARGSETYKYLTKGAKPLTRRQPVATSGSSGQGWFAHMDTNGDGDISRREFLGTAPQFSKLDANSDGYIDQEEAE